MLSVSTNNISKEVPEGACLLVSGLPMTGKYDLLLDVLATDTDAIIITTNTSAETLREDYSTSGDPGQLSIIDCVSRSSGLETADSEDVRYVSAPSNLARISTAFTDLSEQYTNGAVQVGLHSLSPLLVDNDLRSVYRFLHILTGQVRSADWLYLATLDPTMHDEQTVNTVSDPFDGVVETRDHEDQRETRVKSLDSTPTKWTPF